MNGGRTFCEATVPQDHRIDNVATLYAAHGADIQFGAAVLQIYADVTYEQTTTSGTGVEREFVGPRDRTVVCTLLIHSFCLC
jgi:hypothetical protein